MSMPTDQDSVFPDEDVEHLTFLRDEGFEVLALYRSIRDKQKRSLLRELIRTVAQDQPKVDGDGLSHV